MGYAQLDAAPDEVAHLTRDTDADGVGEHDLVRIRRREPPCKLENPAGIDPALERAAERGADRNGGSDPVIVGAGDDPLGCARATPRPWRSSCAG